MGPGLSGLLVTYWGARYVRGIWPGSGPETWNVTEINNTAHPSEAGAGGEKWNRIWDPSRQELAL